MTQVKSDTHEPFSKKECQQCLIYLEEISVLKKAIIDSQGKLGKEKAKDEVAKLKSSNKNYSIHTCYCN